MSSDFRFNITESFKSGIDFYGISAKQAESDITISSDTTVSAIKIAFAISSISIDSYMVTIGQENQRARANVDITSSVSSSAMQIQYSQIGILINSALLAQTIKFAYAQSSISIDSSVQSSGEEILYASASIIVDSNNQTIAKKISYALSNIAVDSTAIASLSKVKYASASIPGITVIVTTSKATFLAQSGISVSSSALVTAIKFAVNDIPDTSSYRTLFVIDNKPLTNQGRTMNSDQSMVFVENKNWNNLKSRYYKRSSSAGRNSFTLSWSFLPGQRYDTIDRRYARDYIKEIASDPDVHILKIVNNDFTTQTPYTETEYNVFVRDYSETLVRRDLQNDVYYWDCSLTLEEV